MHIIGKSKWKERYIVERDEQQNKDIDDLIFEGEEWHPSNR